MLVVGDGDLSFGHCLAESSCYKSLTVSTWDSPEKLFEAFPKSKNNVLGIEAKANCRIEYNIDATKINNLTNYNLIIWNFPHIVGKQNIRYNRLLLNQFLKSCHDALMPCKGMVLLTLTQKQSGVHALTEDDWNKSWKLVHQAAEADLMLTEVAAFDNSAYPGYTPIGHRGYGGKFSYTLAEIYRIDFPKPFVKACQAPLYLHEIHLLNDCAIANLVSFEHHARLAAARVCDDLGFEDALWSLHLVDLYVCPRTRKVSHTLQVNYALQF